MDDAQRARLFKCIDSTMELVEFDTHADEPGWADAEWTSKVNALIERGDNSFETVVRMMSLAAASSVQSVASSSGESIEEVLRQMRLFLLANVENRWA